MSGRIVVKVAAQIGQIVVALFVGIVAAAIAWKLGADRFGQGAVFGAVCVLVIGWFDR